MNIFPKGLSSQWNVNSILVIWIRVALSIFFGGNYYISNANCNITDGRCRQSVKVSRDKRVRAEWPEKLDVILK